MELTYITDGAPFTIVKGDKFYALYDPEGCGCGVYFASIREAQTEADRLQREYQWQLVKRS